jgi:hypothetical protein
VFHGDQGIAKEVRFQSRSGSRILGHSSKEIAGPEGEQARTGDARSSGGLDEVAASGVVHAQLLA